MVLFVIYKKKCIAYYYDVDVNFKIQKVVALLVKLFLTLNIIFILYT